MSQPNDKTSFRHEKLADTIISLLYEPFLILDKNFIVQKSNDAFYQQFSPKEEHIVGENFFLINEKIFDVAPLRKAFASISTEEKKTETEVSINERNISFNMQSFIFNNEIAIFVALKETTAEKKQSAKLLAQKEVEKNLRLILESIPQITITLSADGYVTFFNQFFLDYTGLPFDEAITSKGWKQIIHPEDLEPVIRGGQNSLMTGEDFYKELRLKRKWDNKYRWHIAKASAIKDNKGKVKFWVGAATDIEEQKIKEQKKDEFISVASHEMKTPLTTAKAYLQLLEQSLNKEEKSFLYASKAGAAVERLNDLIEELLDVSKIQFGKLDYNISTFDFNKMIDHAIESIQHSSVNHVIIKTGKVEKEVTGDKERIEQVVINLLSNAVKYSPDSGKVFIHVENENEHIKVSVKDTGIGISSQHIQKIFDRYYRIEDNSIQFSGLGIGLFISNEIIHRHHGKLWAESEIGKGSTFYFTLPYYTSV